MKVLITGFDPFGGEPINPAYEAVKKMSDQIGDCQVVKCEVPTVFGKSVEVLTAAIAKEQPNAVICVGQAGGRFTICPEVVAINLDEARIPDNEGNRPHDAAIESDGKNAYFSTLPNKAIVQALHRAGLPAQLSYSAGTYVCNHIFYGLMHLLEKKYPQIRGGFIHVPFITEQVVDKKNMPSMSLADLTKALEIAVQITATTKKDAEVAMGETH